jgi:hypothetical protein
MHLNSRRLFPAAALLSASSARAQVMTLNTAAPMNGRGAKSNFLLVSVRFALGLLLSSSSVAWAVTFQFTGQLSPVTGPGADLISNVVAVGMPCSGTVTYEPQAAVVAPHDPTNEVYYEFKGTDMRVTLVVGTNVFTSTDSSSCQVEVIYKIWSPISDGLRYEAVGALLNGAPLPGATDSQYLEIEMLTTNLDALSSNALPTQPPQLDSFVVNAGSGYRDIVFYTYKGGSLDYEFDANLSSITAPPVLSAQLSQGQLVISWPAAAGGFQLESTQTPELTNSWNVVATTPTLQEGAFQVPVATNGTSSFFRLNKL